MNKGKETCRILKDIRRQIAEANDIKLVTEECKHKGECSGTCPRCEAEVRYLEMKLHQRLMLGRAVVMAGLSLNAGLCAAAPFFPAINDNDSVAVCTDSNKVGKYQIKGEVRDDLDVIMGANVVVRGKGGKIKYHAVTDSLGNFILNVDSLPVTIETSFVGYSRKRTDIDEKNYQDIQSIVLADFNEFVVGEVAVMHVKKKKSRKASKK